MVTVDGETMHLYTAIEVCLELLYGRFGPSNNSSTKSLWLRSTNLPYKWSSHSSGVNTIKEANPISKFICIQTLLNRINTEMGTTLNSCLIQFYPSGASGIRLHDDFEWELDQTQPFVNVSIGSCRKIEFFHNYQKASQSPLKVI